MKTTKLILAIAFFAFSTMVFSQTARPDQNEPVPTFSTKMSIKAALKSHSVVSSRLGRRAVEDGEKIGLVDSIDPDLIHSALALLQERYPELHQNLLEKISYDGILQMYWAHNLPSAAAVFSMDLGSGEEDAQEAVGFLLDHYIKS